MDALPFFFRIEPPLSVTTWVQEAVADCVSHGGFSDRLAPYFCRPSSAFLGLPRPSSGLEAHAAALIAYARGGAGAGAITIVFPLSVAAYCMPWLGVIPALRRRGITRVKDIP